jgi:hypothetical protein
MPASIPTSKTTTLTHIISDPIIFPRLLLWVESRSGEPELTPCPRLCDLMSPMGLAYLILGIGTVERFNALL